MAVKSWKEQCREKRRFWQVHIKAWAGSGLLQTEYCRQHNLNNHQFGYWKKKFSAEEKKSKQQFIPVPATLPITTVQNSKDSGLEVLVGDVAIKLSSTFNSDALVRAVKALGGRP